MLLRSSSTPILNSWIPIHHSNSSRDCSPDNNNHNNNNHNHHNNQHDLTLHLPSRTKSITALTTSSSSSPIPSPTGDHHHHHHHQPKPATRTLSDTDLRNLTSLPSPHTNSPTTPLQRMFSSSGLDEAIEVEANDEIREKIGLATVTEGGGGGGDGGRHGGCGGGGGGGYYGYSNNNSSNYGHWGSVEAYYQKMIEANPGNSLLLGNYARFLKEERGELDKAEEYCGRAILASPAADANMLSLYADIIWQTQRDAQRAESYFDQAVKTAPDDCYVLASYAKFLWDAEDEEELEEEDDKLGSPSPSPPKYWEGTPHRSPLAAA